MADIYVRSSDGNDADNGSTWALAKATLLGAAAIDVAGDTIYVSSAHYETNAAHVTYALAGENGWPVKVVSVNDTAAPPTATAQGALIETTGASNITVSGAGYIYGMTFSAGSGANNALLSLNPYNANANKVQTYEKCTFLSPASGLAAGIRANGASGANSQDCSTVWKDCDIRTASTLNDGVRIFGRLRWTGGAVLAGQSSSARGLISGADSVGESSLGDFSGLDLSNMPAGRAIFQSSFSTAQFIIINSKLPAGWNGGLVNGTINVGDRFEMYNCDSADTNYRLWVEDYAGSIKSETTIVRTGGASDGTTPFAWRMVSSAAANYPLIALETPGLPARWNATVGTPITITVEIVHDSLTALTDAEVWLDVQFLGTTGFPLSVFKSDAKTDILATAANQTASSEAWTTTGLTNPNKQKLSVTVTPQEVGFIQAKVHLAKASYTVFVDPKLTVS